MYDNSRNKGCEITMKAEQCNDHRKWWLIVWLVFVVLFTERAWLHDDMAISYRVVDNVWNGHGLRWNLDERVEVYTHPLWLGLHIALAPLSENLFFITALLSFICCVLSILFIQKLASALGMHRLLALAMAIGILVIPRSLRDFMLSGMENPLIYVLVTWFAWQLYQDKKRGEIAWLRLSLLCSAVLLTRMDLALIFAPPMILLVFKHLKDKAMWVNCTLGLMPFFVWKIFSFWYYGFLFPNTKYAKLPINFTIEDRLSNGMRYLEDIVLSDPIGMLLMVGMLVLAFVRLVKPRTYSMAEIGWGIGGVLYFVYVLSIGGGYMSGRFWSVLMLMGAIFLMQEAFLHPLSVIKPVMRKAVLVAVVLWAGMFVVRDDPIAPTGHGIFDMRAQNALFGGVVFDWKREQMNDFPVNFTFLGNKILRVALPPVASDKNVFVGGAIGMIGYLEEEDILIVDVYALADVLLARLPAVPLSDPVGGVNMPGHHYRNLPMDYLEYRVNDKMDIDEDLLTYAQAIRVITSGDLWSMERLETIIDFNVGKYDQYLQRYLEKNHFFFYGDTPILERIQ